MLHNLYINSGDVMRFTKQLFAISIVLPLIAGLAGCASSMIGVRPGVERISLADANQVGACQSKGKVIVSVMAKVGFIDRTEEVVEADLYQMALNDAADAGADTVVKGESKEFGKRTYELYKCRP
jgi:Domain of unknown function (DUF4156)